MTKDQGICNRDKVAAILREARGCEHSFPCGFCNWDLESKEESGCLTWADKILEAISGQDQ